MQNTPETRAPETRVAELADAVVAHAIGAEDGTPDAAEKLRAIIHAELDRAGTTVGLLDAFDLPPELRAARVMRIKVDEDYFAQLEDRALLSTMLITVFAATAFHARRLRMLNATKPKTV